MNENWPLRKLGDLYEIARGGSPRPIKQYLTTEEDGVNWIKIGDATASSKYIYETKEKIKPEGVRNSRLVQEGDFILSNSMSFGRPYIMKTKGCIHDGWLVLHPKTNDVEQDFLFHLLGSPYAFNQFDSLAAGTCVRNLNSDLVRGVEIPVPPKEEQQRIVAILDEAFAGIATATANAEKNLQNARELFESTLQSVFSEKGEGFESKKLGDTSILKIIDGDRGVNYPKKSDFTPEGHCLFLNTKNVRPNGFNFDTVMFVSEEKDNALRKGKLVRNDVLLTTRGTIGNLAVYDDSVSYENVRINSGMLIFRPNTNKLLPAYLFEVFRSGIMKRQITKYVSGAAQPQLPIKTLINFSIPVPNTVIAQQKIVDRLKSISAETQRLESIYQQKLTELTELKQSLLKKAFAGELH